ncbi:MAG: hypothetical protein ACRESR_07860 [Gammaproteobacteria bacterium]
MIRKLMIVAIAGATLALAACASQPTGKAGQQTARNQETHKVKVCVAGPATGFHIQQKSCRTVTVANRPSAQGTSAEPGSNQQKTTAEKQKTRRVCSTHRRLGSHLAHTVCINMTEVQYEAYEKAKAKSADAARAAFEHAVTTGGGG